MRDGWADSQTEGRISRKDEFRMYQASNGGTTCFEMEQSDWARPFENSIVATLGLGPQERESALFDQ